MVSCELINFAAGDPDGFVSLCESRYHERVESAARKVLASGCPIVMLTGPSSTGKTTTAHRLAESAARCGKKTDVISLDDFYAGEGKYPKRADGTDDYECLEALDLVQLHRCLAELETTGECDVPQFDFVCQRPSGKIRHVDCRRGVAVIEGLHAFNPALTESLKQGSVFHIYAGLREEYCDPEGVRTIATRDVRLARRISRDCLFRGHEAAFTLELWPHVCAAENKYIRAYKGVADLVLDTSFSYEACIWDKLLAPLANTVPSGAAQASALNALCTRFSAFRPLSEALVPKNSMLREFIGQN
jgi:uridine kinase